MTAPRVAGLALTVAAVAALAGCTAGSGPTCTTSITLVNDRADGAVELSNASAQLQLDGRVIALFATDYAQDGLTAPGRQPEMAPEGTLLWIDLGDPSGMGEPLSLAAGDSVEFGAGDPPIIASHWTPERFDMLAPDATGTVEVRQLGESVCVDVDLQGDAFTVSGTISAPLDFAP